MNHEFRFNAAPALIALLLAVALFAPGMALAKSATASSSRATKTAKTTKSTKTKKSTKGAAADSNQVLVRVGAETITRRDVQRRIDSLPEQFRANYSTPEGRQQLLDRMVEEKVWMQMAVKKGVPQRPQVKEQLDQQRRDLIIRTYLNDVMTANPTVSDSEARAYYDDHLSDYRMPATVTVRHILLKKQSDAKRVLGLARAPKAKWDDLVKKFSVDTLTRASGGSLGTVTQEGQFAAIGAQPALAESAFALGQGKFGGPYHTDKGWHVIQVESVKPESTRPFEQVKPIITRQLNSQRAQDYYHDRLQEARKTLGVKPDSSAIKGFVSQKKSARDMFNEAQGLTAPQARIDAYQKLLQEYPDSEVSPQAQFMVGFINSEELKNYDAAEQAFRELLRRWPKAELAPSAQWMIEHMRSEEAPPFINLEADSAAADAGKGEGSAAPSPKEPVRPAPAGSARPKKGASVKP